MSAPTIAHAALSFLGVIDRSSLVATPIARKAKMVVYGRYVTVGNGHRWAGLWSAL